MLTRMKKHTSQTVLTSRCTNKKKLETYCKLMGPTEMLYRSKSIPAITFMCVNKHLANQMANQHRHAHQACLGATAEDESCPARDIALLPASLGGLGLSQAQPCGVLGGLGRCPHSAPRTMPGFYGLAVRCLVDARGPACLRTALAAR